MNPIETKNGAITDATIAPEPFLVVCADMAFYSSKEQTIGNYEVVYTVATDEEAACNQARQALQDGGIPLAAFDRTTIQKLLSNMDTLKLNPGQAYNWSQDMTDLEVQAACGDGNNNEKKI